MKKDKMSVFFKLWLSVSILIVGYIISMVLVQLSGQKIENGLAHVATVLFPGATSSKNVLSNFEIQAKLYEDAVMMGETALIEQANEESAKAQSAIQQILSLKGISANRKRKADALLQSVKSFTEESAVIYTKMVSGDMDATAVEKAKLNAKIKEQLSVQITDLLKGFSDDLKENMNSMVEYSSWQSRFNLILFGIVLTVSLIVVSLVIKRSIIKPISNATDNLKSLSFDMDSTSEQISTATRQLAQGATDQAASLEETTSSLEEMSSMTKMNAENAGQADTLSESANQMANRASQFMSDLTAAMKDISHASEETSKIINTIEEIAFQTNLLALNAAVEAARAGEAGAGFAVVADEVRNLAMRAADAAKDTSGLIETTMKKVNDGEDMVSKTSEAFTEVSESIQKVNELSSEISAASTEQSQGIDQINISLTEIDKVTQQNAASSEESASAAVEMSSQTGLLKEVVNKMVALVGGNSDGRMQSVLGEKRPLQKNNANNGQPTAMAKSPNTAMAVGNKPGIRPEKILPLSDDDFKDF